RYRAARRRARVGVLPVQGGGGRPRSALAGGCVGDVEGHIERIRLTRRRGAVSRGETGQTGVPGAGVLYTESVEVAAGRLTRRAVRAARVCHRACGPGETGFVLGGSL